METLRLDSDLHKTSFKQAQICESDKTSPAIEGTSAKINQHIVKADSANQSCNTKLHNCLLEYTFDEAQKLSSREVVEAFKEELETEILSDLSKERRQEIENSPGFIKWDNENKNIYYESAFCADCFADLFLLPDGLKIARCLIDKITPEDALLLLGESRRSANEFADIYRDILRDPNWLKSHLTDDNGQPILEALKEENNETAKEIQERVPFWNKEQIIAFCQHVQKTSETPGAEKELKKNVQRCANLLLEKAQQAYRENFEKIILENSDVNTLYYTLEKVKQLPIEEGVKRILVHKTFSTPAKFAHLHFTHFFCSPEGPDIIQYLIDKLYPIEILHLITDPGSEFIQVYGDIKELDLFIDQITENNDQSSSNETSNSTVENAHRQPDYWMVGGIIDYLKANNTSGSKEDLKKAAQELRNNILKYANLMLKKAQSACEKEHESIHRQALETLLKEEEVAAYFK